MRANLNFKMTNQSRSNHNALGAVAVIVLYRGHDPYRL